MKDFVYTILNLDFYDQMFWFYSEMLKVRLYG